MIILTDNQESLSVHIQTKNPSYSRLFSQVDYSFEKPGPLYIFIAPSCNAAKKKKKKILLFEKKQFCEVVLRCSLRNEEILAPRLTVLQMDLTIIRHDNELS